MAINSFTINGDKDYYSYDALLGRVARISFDENSGVLSFMNESGTAKFTVDISSIVRMISTYLDGSLTEEDMPAMAKAVGDAIAEVRNAIPSIDSSLSVPNQAADAKETGDRFSNVNNAISALTERIQDLEAQIPVFTSDASGILDVEHEEVGGD